jgi:chromosome segregation ATPase
MQLAEDKAELEARYLASLTAAEASLAKSKAAQENQAADLAAAQAEIAQLREQQKAADAAHAGAAAAWTSERETRSGAEAALRAQVKELGGKLAAALQTCETLSTAADAQVVAQQQKTDDLEATRRELAALQAKHSALLALVQASREKRAAAVAAAAAAAGADGAVGGGAAAPTAPQASAAAAAAASTAAVGAVPRRSFAPQLALTRTAPAAPAPPAAKRRK